MSTDIVFRRKSGPKNRSLRQTGALTGDSVTPVTLTNGNVQVTRDNIDTPHNMTAAVPATTDPTCGPAQSRKRPSAIRQRVDDCDGDCDVEEEFVTIRRDRLQAPLKAQVARPPTLETQSLPTYSTQDLQALRGRQPTVDRRRQLPSSLSASSARPAGQQESASVAVSAIPASDSMDDGVQDESDAPVLRSVGDAFRIRAPNATLISMAKKHRELRRHLHAGQITDESADFVPLQTRRLDSMDRDSADEGDAVHARLVTDEQDAAEGDDFGEDYADDQLAFGTGAVKRLALRQQTEMREALGRVALKDPSNEDRGESDDDDEDEEENEDMLEWERQQIIKGAGSRNVDVKVIRAPRKLLPMPEASNLKSFGDAMKRVDDRITQIRSAMQLHQTNVSRLFNEHGMLRDSLQALSSEAGQLGEQHNFFQEFLVWLQTLVGLLDSKMPVLESFMKSYLTCAYHHCNEAMGRRRLLCIDDLCQLAGRVPPPTPMGAPSVASIQQMRRVRHQQRMSQVDRKQATVFYEDGMSTDDDDIPYLNQKKQSLDALNHVLDDADESFRSMSSILSRFELWRSNFKQSYDDAFVPLSVADSLQLHVLLETILKWSPIGLDGEPIALPTLQWHKVVEEYQSAAEASNDDWEITCRLVSKIVIPLAGRYLLDGDGMESAYDPFSSRQAHCLIRTILDMHDYCVAEKGDSKTDSFSITTLLEQRLKNSLKLEMETRHPFLVVGPIASPLIAVFRRSIFSVLTLFYNVVMIQRRLALLLPDAFLLNIGSRDYVFTVILPLLHSGVMTCQQPLPPSDFAEWSECCTRVLEKLVELIPTSWFDAVALDGSPKWTTGSMFVWNISQCDAIRYQDATRASALLDRLAKVLVRIGDFEQASLLTKSMQENRCDRIAVIPPMMI